MLIDQEAILRQDEDLVARARAGDLDAFEELVNRHRALVTRVAARIVGSDEAEDIAQETFLRVYHRLGQLRGDASFRAWLLRTATNVALNSLARKRPQAAGLGENFEAVPDAAPRTPADALEAGERRERLQDKLRLLSPSHRAVLVLRDLEGLSYEEIAAATETPLGSVKGRLFRARREMIDVLRANTYDWELPA